MVLTEAITGFRGEFFFLSNFFPVRLTYGGIIYPSSEHAYMAQKTTDMNERLFISQLETPSKAKRYGQTVTLRDGWDSMRVSIMMDILSIKFDVCINPDLYRRLQSTAPRLLIEGNSHGDRFWGQCPLGDGKNNLGKLLMQLRDREDLTSFLC